MRKQYFLFIPAICLYMLSCKQQESKPDFLAANIDTSVKASEDFFFYANGGWIKKNPIPASESGWGIGNLVQEEIYDRLKTINEKAIAEKAAHGTVSQKIADFWKAAMDSDAVNKQGLQPLQNDLQSIDKINSAT